MKNTLDVCCGSRMFWFDKNSDNVVFGDKRKEKHTLNDKSQKNGTRKLEISPDVVFDFSNLPFPNDSFKLVIFDPPHFEKNGEKSWLNLKYGTLRGNWRVMLCNGFSECFRVLEFGGTLIFKWNETEIPVSEILKLSPFAPMVGHKSGKQSKTNWITFMNVKSQWAEWVNLLDLIGQKSGI